jgi:hypothetical protein
MRTKDTFRAALKVFCHNHKRNNRSIGHNWGCPCCVPFRMIGRNNNKHLARRIVRRRVKRNIQSEIE